jgi:E3 ubiquitin-protein ligase HUWE1
MPCPCRRAYVRRFDLLCSIRIARRFGSLAGRHQLVRQRLLAFNVLLQCSPSLEEYNSLYLAEPELVGELVALVQAEEAVADEELRTLALRALAAQLHDRSRSASIIAAVTCGGQSGMLAMLLHKSIASILQQANVPLAPSGSGALPPGGAGAAEGQPAAGGGSAGAGSSAAAAAAAAATVAAAAAAAAPPEGSLQYSVTFVEALLSLVAALVQSTSGCQALNDAGVVPALLPLMRDVQPEHQGLVCTNLRILEAYMDMSQSAASIFRDLGGLSEMIRRLVYEVGATLPPPGSGTDAGGSSSTQQPLQAPPAAAQPPAQAARAEGSGTSASAADADVVMAPAEPQQAPGGSGDASAQQQVKQVRPRLGVVLLCMVGCWPQPQSCCVVRTPGAMLSCRVGHGHCPLTPHCRRAPCTPTARGRCRTPRRRCSSTCCASSRSAATRPRAAWPPCSRRTRTRSCCLRHSRCAPACCERTSHKQ